MDHDDPWVHNTLAWWNEYVLSWICAEGTDHCCRRVFGNERGKVAIADPLDKEHLKWQQFNLRKAKRKAAVRAAEARIWSTPSPSALDGREVGSGTNNCDDTNAATHDEREVGSGTNNCDDTNAAMHDGRDVGSNTNNHDDTGTATHEDAPEYAPESPTGNSTPCSPRPDPVIDPMLMGTLDLDRSVPTLTPSVPQMPDTLGHSHRYHNSSPLSNVPETGTPARMTNETPGLKRKRQASKTDRPKGKMPSKAKRRPAQQ